MTTTILSRSSVLRTFRQLKVDATEDEQSSFWDYMTMKASANAKATMARRLAAGGDGARASVAQAMKEWQFTKFMAGAGSGRGSKQQKAQQQGQHQQRHQQQGSQQQPQHQSKQVRSAPASQGKGKGGTHITDQRHSSGGNAGGGGARARGSPAASSTRTKGAGRARAPWSELVVDGETPLLLPDGERARKCSIAADAPDDDFERARGYIMASSQTALNLACRVARRKDRGNPIVIVHQPVSEYEKGILSDKLREYQEQLGDQADDGDATGNPPLSITVQETTLLLRDPNGGDADSRKAILIHFNDDFSVTTVDQEGADFLQMDIAPELHCPEDDEEELFLTVYRKMCEQLDLKEWADEFFSFTDKKVLAAAVQKVARSGKTDPSLRVRLLADRGITFHGHRYEEGKIRAIITVPKQEVNEFMCRAGEYGVIYEFTDRSRNDGWKKINLPLEWSLNDIIKAIASLPNEVRAKVRGFVPTMRGYAVRVDPADEALVTTVLLPELAEQLGSSLGLRPNSAWLLKNLPRRINRQGIIQMLAADGGRWQPWHVLPRYAVNDRNPRHSTWVVDAEGPPPLRVIKARDTYVTIERFVDEKKLSPSMRVWAKPVSQWDRKPEAQRSTARTPWADVVDDDVMSDVCEDGDLDAVGGGTEGETHGKGAGHGAAAQTWGPTNPAQTAATTGRWQKPRAPQWQQTARQPQDQQASTLPTGTAIDILAPTHRRPRSFPLTDSSGTDTSSPPHAKRMFGAPSRRGAATSPITSPTTSSAPPRALEVDPEKQAMMAALAEKDMLIASLQESVSRMQRTLEAMLTAMTANGTIPPGAAAAAMAEACPPAQPTTTQQLQPPSQEQQVQPLETDGQQAGATMWARTDDAARDASAADNVDW